jgi:hypothetical protein
MAAVAAAAAPLMGLPEREATAAPRGPRESAAVAEDTRWSGREKADLTNFTR